MNNKILIALLAVVIVVAGGFALLSNSSKNPAQPAQTQTAPQTTQQTQVQTQPTTQASEKEVIVTVTKDGFEPQSITVKAGTRITWNNKSGAEATVNSDNHPTHLLYKELNLGLFPNDTSVQVQVNKPGKYTYHDHLHPSRTGTIVVE